MDNIFLFEKNPFHAFTMQHALPIAFVFMIGLISILWAKYKLGPKGQKSLLLFLAAIPFIGYFILLLFGSYADGFNVKEHLPFHVCRFLALASIYFIWKNNRFWLGVMYFWILAGTLNANITPDIRYGFPSWDYFSYWMMHSFLIILPIYYVVVFKIRVTFKDFKNAFWTGNLFLIFSLVVNYLLGSNYMYTMEKPPADTILDKMGDWPIYLLTTQLLAGVLFFILYLPFLFTKKKS